MGSWKGSFFTAKGRLMQYVSKTADMLFIQSSCNDNVISKFLLNLEVSGAICNVIAGILYVALALAGITLLLQKNFKSGYA